MEYLAGCDFDDFEQLLESRFRGYTPLKRLLDELKPRLSALERVEQKLIAREALEKEEQALYDRFDLNNLQNKVHATNLALQTIVEAAHLNAMERAQVLEQLTSKASNLEAELKRATEEGKVKLQQKLEEQKLKLRQMRQAISAAADYTVPLLRGLEIKSLHGNLTAIQHIEKKTAAQRSSDELRRLAGKTEITEQVAALEAQERMLLETDEEFKPRLKKCINEIKFSELKRQAEMPAKPSEQRSGYPVEKPRVKTKWTKADVFSNSAAVDAGRMAAPFGELVAPKATEENEGAAVETKSELRRQLQAAPKKKDKRRFMKLDAAEFFAGAQAQDEAHEDVVIDTTRGTPEVPSAATDAKVGKNPEEKAAADDAAARRAEEATARRAEKAEKAARNRPRRHQPSVAK